MVQPDRRGARIGLLIILAALLPGTFRFSGPAQAGALAPPAWVYRSPATSAARRASWEALLYARLDEGDRRRLPRAQRLPDGRTRYIYRGRTGEPPLNLAQIQALLRNPPRYEAERQAIAGLLEQLRSLGVSVELKPARVAVAAGEWDPASATVRIRPDVAGQGSRAFARVLNHEAIHVAQSCRGGGVRRTPRPLGLSRHLTAETATLLAAPPYRRISPLARQLEEEAFAHQDDLSSGRSLLARLCRRSTPQAGRLGP